VRTVADPEIEAALELARAALQRMGVSGPELTAISVGVRRRAYGTPSETAPASREPEAGEEPSAWG
jgi:hypothetical protein